MRFVWIAALLLWGCGYRQIEIDLPASSTTNKQIHIRNHAKSPWIVGYIYEKKKIQAPITLQKDLGDYLVAKLAHSFKKSEDLRIDLDIRRIWIGYYPDKKGDNLYGYLFIEAKLHARGKLVIKKVVIKRTLRIENTKVISKVLKEMLDEAAEEIVQTWKEVG